jgi:hypothetical protein
MNSLRWQHHLLVFHGTTVVGTIERDAFDRGWWAYGCRDDWQDTPLRLHASPTKAKKAVMAWAVERIEDAI